MFPIFSNSPYNKNQELLSGKVYECSKFFDIESFLDYLNKNSINEMEEVKMSIVDSKTVEFLSHLPIILVILNIQICKLTGCSNEYIGFFSNWYNLNCFVNKSCQATFYYETYCLETFNTCHVPVYLNINWLPLVIDGIVAPPKMANAVMVQFLWVQFLCHPQDSIQLSKIKVKQWQDQNFSDLFWTEL